MILKRTIAIVVIMLSLALSAFIYFYQQRNSAGTVSLKGGSNEPTVTPEGPFYYNAPVIQKNNSYRLVVVGDSMTKALGPNANKLRLYLKEYYKDSEFVTYNYGFSSTNIESLPQRLTEKTINEGTEHIPILKQGFEIILIESFGYNPLSESSLENGLKKQEEVLEQSLKLIAKEKPNVAILFMTPIAPDPETFAQATIDLTPEKRKEWVAERVSYIKNFSEFAKTKNIPLIDIYTLSLNEDGTINKSLISGDYIHPSVKGIDLMAREIADFIYVNKIIPE